MKKDYLAKPSGILLVDHVQNLLSEAEALLNMIPYAFEKYDKLVGLSLYEQLQTACRRHDTGKKIEQWQNACQADFKLYKEYHERTGKSWKQFEKDNKNLAGKNLRHAGVRHEIYSILINEPQFPFNGDEDMIPLKVAIAAHHGKLTSVYRDKWKESTFRNASGKDFIKELYRYIERTGTQRKSFENVLKEYYKTLGVRSLLVLVDHWASAKEQGELIPPVGTFQYSFPDKWERRPVQKLAEENWKQDFLLLRAPTGAGKTDACLLWAKKQVENKRAERLIIAMPTRFTSNALELDVSQSVSETGLYHSTAFYNKFNREIKEGKVNWKEAKTQHKFSRFLLSPVTVCTIDHLLMGLTLTREDHHISNFNLANSCVVIDEADFYDDFTQANIIVLLKVLRGFNVPVMLMSASLPESSISLYEKSGYDISTILEDTSDSTRKRCEIKSIQKYKTIEDVEGVLSLCIEKGNAIIYVNTVARAFELHSWFEKQGVKPIIYHSRFTEPDKKEKEKELKEALGKKAWEDGVASGIAIMTQIGEMSVNISSEIMVSELCPIDRLVQRAGRLERFNKDRKGELHVLVPQKDSSLYPAPYGTFENRKWIPSAVLEKTYELISCKDYSSAEYVELINQVYNSVELSQLAIQNSNALQEYFIHNWLIGSKEKTQEDDSDTVDWKSRNIANNTTVYTEEPENVHFYHYGDFLEYKQNFGIDVYPYLVKKARKKGSLYSREIFIAEVQQEIFITNRGVYGFEFGLNMEAEIDTFI